jgi:predicted ester cyclase
MSEENKALVRRWFREVWGDNGSESAIPEMFHENGRAHGFPDPESVVTSPAAFAEHCKNFRKVFPDIRITVDDLVAEGDKVAVRWTAKMTHTGDDLGFHATSKPVRVVGSSFLICGKGKILEGWNYMDLTRMRLQLQDKL